MIALVSLVLTGASVQSWEHFTHFGSIGSMAISGSTLAAATSGGVAFATLTGESLTWDSVWVYPGELSSSDCREVVIEPGPPLRYWVGTWGGGIDIYTPGGGWQHIGQLEGLPVHQEISSISIADTSVFAGTSEGLAIKQFGYFQTWTELSTGGGLPSDYVNCLQACDSGLYVGTSLGLAMLTTGGYPGSAGSWVQDTVMQSRSIRGMCLSEDTLWAATDDGLWFKAQGSAFVRESGYPGISPLCVSVSGGRIVAGEDGAVAVKLGGIWDYWDAIPGQLSRDAVFQGDSLVLVGTTNRLSSQKDCGLGLARGWGDGWVASYAGGLTANDVRSIAVGPSGDFWAATNHVGLNVLSGEEWTSFHDIFPSEHQMFAVAALPEGGVFVSHYYFGVTYVDWNGTPETSDDQHFTWDTSNSGLLNNQITSLSAGAAGTVWFGQEPFYATPSEPSGVSRLQWTEGDASTSVWTSWTPSTGLPSGRVAAVVDAGGGTAWVGSEAGLVLVGPGPYDVSEVIGVAQGLPSAGVRSLALARDGRLFVGTTSGLAVVEPGSFAAAAVADADGTILAVACDHLGATWAAATDALYRVAPEGSVEAYNIYNSPLLSTIIYSLAADANAGLIYLATDHGAWRLDLGGGLSEGTEAVLFPNPFLPGRGDVLGVAGLPDLPTSVRVFDLNGGLVYECSSQDRDGLAWNGLGSDGEPVASGVYVVEVEQAGFTGLLKLAIVR